LKLKKKNYKLFNFNFFSSQPASLTEIPSSISSMAETTFIETITTTAPLINSVPSALPTPTSAPYEELNQSQLSPSIKSKAYKKIKTDDMDK
jgi:hypothetical protein